MQSIFGLQSFASKLAALDYVVSKEFLHIMPDFDRYSSDESKLAIIFSNPAVLKVFKLQCDMFSLGEVYVYQNGKAVEKDPFLDLVKRPNPFQQKSQFLWDFMFWKMVGNAYCYFDSDIVTSDTNKLYFLDSSKLTFPPEMDKYKDKLILSKASENLINNFHVAYTYADGTQTKIKWSKISHITDLSNGTGNWFRGRSTIDALYKIISNSESAIDSKNINIDYAGKYIVSGQQDPMDVTSLPMAEDEKNDIETKMNGRKKVHAMKSMIEIKRFVEDASIVGELTGSFLSDYYMIGSLYNIPSDVLEAYNKSSTFENQEKARGAHVSYTLNPAGKQLCNIFEDRFGYKNKQIVIDWEHLPFMMVFAKERAETDKIKSETLLRLMQAGVPVEDINRMLDLELTELDYESAKRQNVQPGPQA